MNSKQPYTIYFTPQHVLIEILVFFRFCQIGFLQRLRYIFTDSMMIVLNTLVTNEVHVVQVLKHMYIHVQSFEVALYYHILDVYKPR